MSTSALDLGKALAESARLCPGVTDALLVDADGVLIEAVRLIETGIDHEEAAAEGLAAALSLARFAAAARIGTPSEWMLSGEHGIAVVRRIPGADAVILLCAQEKVFTGRVRFTARVIAGRLSPMLK